LWVPVVIQENRPEQNPFKRLRYRVRLRTRLGITPRLRVPQPAYPDAVEWAREQLAPMVVRSTKPNP
jgi:hypothetical protein